MKKFRNILIGLMSLLVVFAGAGVSVIHYCCNSCEAVQACCKDGCSKCHKMTHHDTKKSCKDEGCTATFHKVDLVKQVVETSFTVPLMPVICELLPDFRLTEPLAIVEAMPQKSPPQGVGSRVYLALYSVLLI